MSRSNNQQIDNPITKKFTWNSEEGKLLLFDKDLEDGKGATLEVNLPFSFVVLDEVHAIRGWNDDLKASIYSNICKRDEKGFYIVDLYKVEHPDFPIKGFWEDIRKQVAGWGGQWCKRIFAIVNNPDSKEPEIVEIELKGLVVAEYMNKIKKPFEGIIEISTVQEKAGKNKKKAYKIPLFTQKEATPQLDEAAKNIDETILQPYIQSLMDFQTKKNQKSIPQPQQPHEQNTNISEKEPDPINDEPTDDLPF